MTRGAPEYWWGRYAVTGPYRRPSWWRRRRRITEPRLSWGERLHRFFARFMGVS